MINQYPKWDPNTSISTSFEALAKMLVIMRLSGFVMAIYAIGLGITILVGGPLRFSQAGYRAAMIIPGAPASWGWALLIFGALAFFGLKNRVYGLGAIGMFLSGVWCFAFGGAFLVSAMQYPEANLTGMTAYGKDGVIFVLMAVVHMILSRIPTKPEDYLARQESDT